MANLIDAWGKKPQRISTTISSTAKFPATAPAAEPPISAAGAETRFLPCSITVTKMPLNNPPDYFGGNAGNPYTWVDFPVCPVLIDGEYWVIYKSGDNNTVYRWQGTNIENGQRQPDGFASFPVLRPYMLGGMWYDSPEKKLYAPMHCEYFDSDKQMQRQIHLATSTDKGLTWHYEGAIVTRDYPNGPFPAPADYSGVYWDGGAGDFFIYVDQRGGHIYLYAGAYVFPKKGLRGQTLLRHQVARCAISDKMMPGKWRKFYNGSWNEPGQGGKSSSVNAYYVMYNSYLGKYLGFNYGSSIAICSDLAKQDWSPCFKIKGDAWGCNDVWAWHVVNDDKIDIFSGGRNLFLYSYWKANGRQAPTRLYKIDLGPGKTPAVSGYMPEWLFFQPITSMDPMNFYEYEPLYESADPVESRHTRRVNCASQELAYSGEWTGETDDRYYEKTAKVSGTANCSVQFSFKGPAVYWRAYKGPDGGRADVYVDNLFQKTVDCYSEPGTGCQFAFIQTGLAPDVTHTIKIVVRGDKNDLSNGTAVKHMLFEYSAESYRASDGFSGVMGKNNWHYQQRKGAVYTNMSFADGKWVGNKCEMGCYHSEISHYHIMPDNSETVRKWVAPHAGAVRMEGSVSLYSSDGDGIQAMILKNEAEVWSARIAQDNKLKSYDMTLAVSTGDAIYFIAKRNGEQPADRAAWDPVITYVAPEKSE